jgi:hypothetical protein
MFAPEQLQDHVDASSPLVSPNMLSPDSLAPGTDASSGGVLNGANRGKISSSGGKKQARKASTVNVRNWLRIDEHGETNMMQADKWKLTHKLGVQVGGAGCWCVGGVCLDVGGACSSVCATLAASLCCCQHHTRCPTLPNPPHAITGP